MPNQQAEGRAGRLPTTQWTLVARVHSPDANVARLALNELCTQYHFPLYAFIRRRGLAHHDAQDALHDFLAKLLRLDAFHDLDAEKGRLRTFLAKSLDRFLITRYHSEHRRTEREVSMDDLPFEMMERRYQKETFIDSDTPERLFDKQWCAQLLDRVLRRLADYYKQRGQLRTFEALRPVILSGGSLIGFDTEQIALSLGISPGALRTKLEHFK